MKTKNDNEKKKISISLILFVIVALILGSIIIISNRNKENYITDNEYLYDMALNYLIKQDSKESTPDHEYNSYHFFATYDGFGITEKDNKKYVYMWVLGEGYYLDNNKDKKLSGYSMFYKFTFENKKIIKVKTPEDGNYYEKSVKSMCADNNMSKKVLNYNSNLSLEKQVNNYYK